jgi:predicted dithiol-disulfide oxidoreductase (DUF899 family)
MTAHKVVSNAEWVKARRELLVKEKELTRLRDELSKKRRELPWEKLEKTYQFDGPEGMESLSDLFDGRSQLVVYHFMFGVDWEEGCKSCSLLADHYDPAVIHLNQRDVTLVTISRAPIAKLIAFKKRMGWNFKWVSSQKSDFNLDYHVSSANHDELQYYNYEMQPFPCEEQPGMSVFCKDEKGDIFHTYSSFGRGLDPLLAMYQVLDFVPKGRDEEAFTYGMEWVRHHDKYGDNAFVEPYAPVILERRKSTAT